MSLEVIIISTDGPSLKLKRLRTEMIKLHFNLEVTESQYKFQSAREMRNQTVCGVRLAKSWTTVTVGAFTSAGAWRIYAEISKKTGLLSSQVQPTRLPGENSSRCKRTKYACAFR